MLMLRAHTSGALDFSQSDRYSRSWVLKEMWVLEQIETAALTRIMELRHGLHVGAIGGVAGTETYTHHFQHAHQALDLVCKLLMPWFEWKTGQDVNVEDHIKAWEEAYNIKMGSPEWDAMMNKFTLYEKSLQAERTQDA